MSWLARANLTRGNKPLIRRRHIVEVAGALCFLVAAAWLLSFLSPYQAVQSNQSDVSFYESDKSASSANQVFRAKVIGERSGKVNVLPIEGDLRGQEQLISGVPIEGLAIGDTVLLTQQATSGRELTLFDHWRLPTVIFSVLLFIVIIALVGRRRGLTSLVGLAVSIFVIGAFIIPQIANGANPFWICVMGAYAIAVSSILIAHGISKRTIVSLCIVLGILSLTVALAAGMVAMTHLRGINDDATAYLGVMSAVDMQGVLIGGIIIATLGVLDDIVTAQVAVVDELQKVGKPMSVRALYKKAASVGAEHIASLVNTLALVYVGVALPMLLSLVMFQSQQVGWSPLALLNSEFIAQEIIRTVVASIGLVVAVPISTFGAAYLLTHWHRVPLLERLSLR
ncbi:YibE/F-like protein [compost metagenome]